MNFFFEVIETVGKAIDATGVAVIAIGALLSATGVLRRLRTGGDAYKAFRQQLGRSILLGLELLVAADIIRTVAVTPDARSVAVLAGIVLIRTFLSFFAGVGDHRLLAVAEEPTAGRA